MALKSGGYSTSVAANPAFSKPAQSPVSKPSSSPSPPGQKTTITIGGKTYTGGSSVSPTSPGAGKSLTGQSLVRGGSVGSSQPAQKQFSGSGGGNGNGVASGVNQAPVPDSSKVSVTVGGVIKPPSGSGTNLPTNTTAFKGYYSSQESANQAYNEALKAYEKEKANYEQSLATRRAAYIVSGGSGFDFDKAVKRAEEQASYDKKGIMTVKEGVPKFSEQELELARKGVYVGKVKDYLNSMIENKNVAQQLEAQGVFVKPVSKENKKTVIGSTDKISFELGSMPSAGAQSVTPIDFLIAGSAVKAPVSTIASVVAGESTSRAVSEKTGSKELGEIAGFVVGVGTYSGIQFGKGYLANKLAPITTKVVSAKPIKVTPFDVGKKIKQVQLSEFTIKQQRILEPELQLRLQGLANELGIRINVPTTVGKPSFSNVTQVVETSGKTLSKKLSVVTRKELTQVVNLETGKKSSYYSTSSEKIQVPKQNIKETSPQELVSKTYPEGVVAFAEKSKLQELMSKDLKLEIKRLGGVKGGKVFESETVENVFPIKRKPTLVVSIGERTIGETTEPFINVSKRTVPELVTKPTKLIKTANLTTRELSGLVRIKGKEKIVYEAELKGFVSKEVKNKTALSFGKRLGKQSNLTGSISKDLGVGTVTQKTVLLDQTASSLEKTVGLIQVPTVRTTVSTKTASSVPITISSLEKVTTSPTVQKIVQSTVPTSSQVVLKNSTQPTKQLPSTAVKVSFKPVAVTMIKAEPKQVAGTSSYSSTKSVLLPVQSTTTTAITTTTQIIIPKQITVPKQPTTTTSMILPAINFYPFFDEPTKDSPKPPTILDPKSQKRKQKDEPVEEKTGFALFLKPRKGKPFARASRSLELEQALKLGVGLVSRTSKASFRIMPVSEKPEKLNLGGNLEKLAKEYYLSKTGAFVEKRKYRIDTPIEKQEITLKGILSRRGKNK